MNEFDINRLATYNSEVARGLVHTEVYKKKMEKLQAEFNEWQRIEAEKRGWIVVPSTRAV